MTSKDLTELYLFAGELEKHVASIDSSTPVRKFKFLNKNIENAFLKYYELELEYSIQMEGLTNNQRNNFSDLLSMVGCRLGDIDRLYFEKYQILQEEISKKKRISKEDEIKKQLFDEYYLETTNKIGEYELEISPFLNMWYEWHDKKKVFMECKNQEN
ncbi:MAG: hypothetical protein KC516_02930 [Nanoarchaeota archaeon]|nr:hypothetical protein [Nanoarchaeota archaeon]